MILLGIDSGTQSTKTIALDAGTGVVLAQASEAHGLIPDLPAGHMEQDPAVWVKAVENTVAAVSEKLGTRKNEVRGIGVSGQQHGFVPLNAAGEVIRPAKLWCDTSTTAECSELSLELGGKAAVITELGNDILPGFTAPKILWLKKNEPAHFAKLATILLPHDYLNFFLTGNKRMEFGDASGTALLDVRKKVWSTNMLDAIAPGLASKLPPLGSSREAAGVLKTELAKRWGFPEGVIVSAGGGDNMMGAIGTGNVEPGRVTASLGTSGTIYAYAAKPVVDSGGEIASFCDSTDAWLPLLCTMNVTVATEAVRNLFGWDHKALEEAVESVPAGADGLLFLPYLQGERTPNLPNGTGVLHGMTTRNMTPGHIARATMEGVTLGLAYGLNRLRELGIHPKEIRLTGGGSQSAVWRKICANVFNCPVVTLQSAEGAALGAAIQALALVNREKTVEGWSSLLAKPKMEEAVKPEEGGFDYAPLLKRQTALTRTLAQGAYL